LDLQKCKSFIFNNLPYGMINACIFGAMRKLSIVNLERELRKGITPKELGAKKIGEGVQNVAYQYETTKGTTPFVIKRKVLGCVNHSPKPPGFIKKYGFRKAITYRAGKFVIQESATKLISKLDNEHPAFKAWSQMLEDHPRYSKRHGNHDIHMNNCGITESGDWIVFDW